MILPTCDAGLPSEKVRGEEAEQPGDGEGFTGASLTVGQHRADTTLDTGYTLVDQFFFL